MPKWSERFFNDRRHILSRPRCYFSTFLCCDYRLTAILECLVPELILCGAHYIYFTVFHRKLFTSLRYPHGKEKSVFVMNLYRVFHGIWIHLVIEIMFLNSVVIHQTVITD